MGRRNDAGAVGTGKGSLNILELQPAGGKPMSWKDFCNGRQVKTGDRCEAIDDA